MKIINIILGLGTAIILGCLIVLGISAFYPTPVSPTYPNYPTTPVTTPCAPNDAPCAVANQKIQAQDQAAQDAFNTAQDAYTQKLQVYDRNLFIIANVIGMVIFAVGFWLLFATATAAESVPIGVMIAGLWSIMYGYGRGWGSVDDRLKFVIGLVIAVIVIGGSAWLVERYAKKRKISN